MEGMTGGWPLRKAQLSALNKGPKYGVAWDGKEYFPAKKNTLWLNGTKFVDKCDAPDGSFTSMECLKCERQHCPFQRYRQGPGMR